MKNEIFEEHGVLMVPCSEDTNRYVACLMQTCRRYNISFGSATEREQKFILETVDELMSQKQAV